MCNINGDQMIILQSCIRTELGIYIFSTQHKIYKIVNLEYVESVKGIFNFGSECIHWLYKAIENFLMLWMETRQKKYNHNNNKAYKQMDIFMNLDHEKGHSRILSNFVLRYQDASRGGSWCKDSYPCSLVNSQCQKDNSEIIYNTFGTIIDDDLLQIQNGGVISICAHDECPVSEINAQDDTSTTIIPIELFCERKHLLYAIAIGKEVSA